jgi:hypothetical protein
MITSRAVFALAQTRRNPRLCRDPGATWGADDSGSADAKLFLDKGEIE